MIIRFSLNVENERADVGLGNRTLPHETNFSGADGDRENSFFHLTTSRIDNYTRLLPSLLKVATCTQTYFRYPYHTFKTVASEGE